MPFYFEDIIIDTSVLIHAGNSSCNCFDAANQLLENILDSNCVICVDGEFNMDVGKNKSLICNEYFRLLQQHHGSFATSFLIKLSQNRRIVEKPKNPGKSKKKIIVQTIRNKRDRVFVSVTCNSHDCLLASHDFEDFPKEKRKVLKSKLKIKILCSEEIGKKEIGCYKSCSK